jgi:hypothetical protein
LANHIVIAPMCQYSAVIFSLIKDIAEGAVGTVENSAQLFLPSFPSAVETVEKHAVRFPRFPPRGSFHSPAFSSLSLSRADLADTSLGADR